MEVVSVQIPGTLYADLYEKFEEDTSRVIEKGLRDLLGAGVASSGTVNQGIGQYPRPKAGTITGRVWEIADQIEHESGQASRDAVVKTCLEEGINVNTASTQYSHWRNAKS